MKEEIIKLIKEHLKLHENMVDARRNYAEDYAYKALIGDRHSGDVIKTKNTTEAFWHDGSRDGHASAVGSLQTILEFVENNE